MAAANEFKITDEIRKELSEIFKAQYAMVEDTPQDLFIFEEGGYANVKEYYNKFSIEHRNVVYSHENKPLMCSFVFTGKRSIKIERLLGKTNLKVIGFKVFKDCHVPMHVDMNYKSIGRELPVYFIVVSASEQSMIYLSNRKDGTRQVGIPGLSNFIFSPTEIEHGAYSADSEMEVVQIIVDHI